MGKKFAVLLAGLFALAAQIKAEPVYGIDSIVFQLDKSGQVVQSYGIYTKEMFQDLKRTLDIPPGNTLTIGYELVKRDESGKLLAFFGAYMHPLLGEVPLGEKNFRECNGEIFLATHHVIVALDKDLRFLREGEPNLYSGVKNMRCVNYGLLKRPGISVEAKFDSVIMDQSTLKVAKRKVNQDLIESTNWDWDVR